MIGPQVFQVLTEFRFEIGSAVANSKALQGAVEGISTAADNTLLSFQRLGLGLVAQMGLGPGSFLGILGAAIQASDKFGQSQRQFANIISSNMDHLTGSIGTFEERMASSAVIMQKINKLAQEFSLPASDLLDMSKLLAATLVPKGLAGTNFGTAIDISRQFLKSAPTLGVDPGLAKGQLLDMIQGRASMNDTLFQRLMNETSAFKPFNKQGGPQAFNVLPAPERVRLVGLALKQFSSDMDVLKGNAMSLSGEMRRLGEAIKGPFSILKPLGDVILEPLLKMLHILNSELQMKGKEIVESLAKFLKPFISDPQALLVNILQLRKLKTDTKLAGEATGLLGIFLGVAHMLHMLGLQGTATHIALTGLTSGLRFLGIGIATLAGWVGTLLMFVTGASSVFGAIFSIMNGLVVVASRVLVPFALMLGLFQLISRARAIAQVEDTKSILGSTPAMATALAKLNTVINLLLEPFIRIYDYVARLIAPLFRVSYYFDILVFVIDQVANAVILVQGTFQGLVYALLETLNQAQSLFTGGGFSFSKIGEAFNAGIDDMIEKNMTAIKNGEGAVVQQTTNIAKIEIQNNFKEQMEPDRIAFTLKDQLLKAANNPGQASGRSLQGAFTR
jgi:hypothetical protein